MHYVNLNLNLAEAKVLRSVVYDYATRHVSDQALDILLKLDKVLPLDDDDNDD